MADAVTSHSLDFLSGGGDMGARIRAYDWCATPLGAPDRWPLPLRTLVGVMLGSGQPMFVVWGDERTLLYNDGYAPLCGVKHPGALGRPFAEVWADIIANVGPIMDRTYAGDAIHMEDIQFTMLDRHGYAEETHFSFSYTPARDDAGVIRGCFCACDETTGKVFADRRLRFLFDLGDRFRELSEPHDIMAVASVSIGMHLGVDRAGYAEYDVTADMFRVERQWTTAGLPAAPETGRLKDFGPHLVELRAGRTVRLCHIEQSDNDAAIVWPRSAGGVRACISVPLMKQGRCVAVFFLHQASPRVWRTDEEDLVRDVAERTWDAVGRSRAEQQLRQDDSRKDEFLATLAHELRNPLAPLRTGVQLLRVAGDDAARAQRVYEMMERQIGHMVRLIDDLLDVSRVSRGLIELRREIVDLRAIVAGAVETSQPLITEARHEFVLTLPDQPAWLHADATRLSQVFSNLLNNAAKYTPAGGRISLSLTVDGDDAVVRVADTGVGIPADMLRSVFDMFTQVNRDNARSQGGLGIGLTLVRRLTEMHGGTVQAESSGAGTIFTICLPLSSPTAVA